MIIIHRYFVLLGVYVFIAETWAFSQGVDIVHNRKSSNTSNSATRNRLLSFGGVSGKSTSSSSSSSSARAPAGVDELKMTQSESATATEGGNESSSSFSSSSSSSYSSSSSQKTLILIRHGCSEANEYMYREGNQWGDPTFTDDPQYIDSTLSEKGVTQAKVLQEQWANGNAPLQIMEALQDIELTTTTTSPSSKSESESESASSITNEKTLDHVLLVTSPLTRTIQTMNIGILPHFQEQNIKLKIVAQPLATERVYTASDTGRPISTLEEEHPHIDFHHAFDHYHERDDGEEKDEKKDEDKDNYPIPHIDRTRKHKWWYTHDEEDNHPYSYEEWRPFDQEQYYAVPGEPKHIFHRRMMKLNEWIHSRDERVIILVTHWGIIRYLTGEEVENCQVKVLDNFEDMKLKDLSEFED